MNASDVVGYTEDGEFFCPACCPDPVGMTPVFADSEWDYYPVCGACLEQVKDVGLTCYGQEQENLRKFLSLLHDKRQARKLRVILSSPNAAV